MSALGFHSDLLGLASSGVKNVKLSWMKTCVCLGLLPLAFLHRSSSFCQDDVVKPATDESDKFPPDYSKLCDTIPIGAKQVWNANKKIISFALFQETGFPGSPSEPQLFSSFFRGALHNIEGAKLYYPDWIVRFHVFGLHQSLEKKLLERGNNVELVRCSIISDLAKSPSRKMMARFLSYDDPDVRFVISRDLDSRFSPRELFAVNQWLSSGATFHTMRDHDHHNVPVLGGMFGIKRGALKHGNISMSSLMMSAFSQHPLGLTGAPGEDQSFLLNYVWPAVSHDTVAHDSLMVRCERFGALTCLEFPFDDHGDRSIFVGQAFKSPGGPKVADFSQYRCNVTCSV